MVGIKLARKACCRLRRKFRARPNPAERWSDQSERIENKRVGEYQSNSL